MPGANSIANGIEAKVVGFLLLGYLSMSRSFAYLVGVPALKVFIGEVVLGAFFLLHTRATMGRWVAALAKPTTLSGVAWGLFLFLGYGVFQLLRGICIGYPSFEALQNLAFNYYPLYFFVGLWVGMLQPKFLAAFIRLLAWWNGIYGVAYLLFLNSLTWTIPGSPDVRLFGQPGGSAVALLGLLSFELNLMRAWPLFLLNSFVMLGVQVRAEWLGWLVAVTVWACVTKRLGRVGGWLMAVALLLGIIYVADINLPGPVGRGGSISVQEILGRALAPLNQEVAAQYAEHAETYVGTVSWRTGWWWAIWDSIHEDPVRTLLGYGYGFPLGSLISYMEGDPMVRTPHNVVFYALGYGGWLGVALFLVFQLCLVRVLWLRYHLTGQPFGLVYWAMVCTEASFGNFLETPFGAIPFYLLVGLAVAYVLVEPIDACRKGLTELRLQSTAQRYPRVPVER